MLAPDEAVETEAGIKGNTDANHGRRRAIVETLMQHDVRASREAAGTSSPTVKSSIQKGTWLYRCQADPKALRARTHLGQQKN